MGSFAATFGGYFLQSGGLFEGDSATGSRLTGGGGGPPCRPPFSRRRGSPLGLQAVPETQEPGETAFAQETVGFLLTCFRGALSFLAPTSLTGLLKEVL